MSSREADFAATTPWTGIINKPSAFSPLPHASSHNIGGNDPVSLSIEQIPGLGAQLATLVSKAGVILTINGRPINPSIILTKADIGLGNVDNTSDATKNAAVATLTNKTIVSPIVTTPAVTGGTIDAAAITNGTIDAAAITNGTITNAAITTPTITGGTHVAITDFGIRSSGSGAFDLKLVNTENLSAARNLTLKVNNAARQVDLSGDITIVGSLTTAGGLRTFGAFQADLAFTAATAVTFPTTGILATRAGAETLTNKTLTSPVINSPTGIFRGDVGLGNVDNTSDAGKPVSTAQQAALDLKQNLISGSFSVSNVPSAATYVGRVIYVTNGNAGAECAAISNGSNWKVIALGANISA